MSIEWFSKLKEIDSLTKMKNLQLKKKNEEEDRIKKLLEKRNEAQALSASLKQTIFHKNSDIADLEKKLKTASEQKQRLVDMGGDDSKIAAYIKEIEKLEEAGLALLTELESIEVELNNNKTFMTGIEKTIKEIEDESRAEIETINQELSNADLRLNLLLQELPPEFKNILVKTTAKKLAHGPFTRIEQGSCYFCRYKISRMDESEIDMLKGLKTCPQCGRIFLPYGA